MKLYHYTTINTLALILKSRKIRFGRLDLVNDPTEGIARDFQPVSKYIFVSCWTDNEEENLALWNMYTPSMRGVRIQIETPLFNSYSINETDNYLFSGESCVNEDLGYFMVAGQNHPIPIEYTDDENLLRPNILTDIGLDMVAVGKYKRSIWRMEQEQRYRLDIFPIDKNVRSENFPDRYNHLIDQEVPAPIEYFDVEIKTEAFNSMKILIGPKIKPGDQEIIESLVSRYNDSIEISASSMTGFVK